MRRWRNLLGQMRSRPAAQNRITTILSTSPIPSMPDISHIRRTIESLSFVPELEQSHIIVVFDAVRDGACEHIYNQYKTRVSDFCSTRRNISMLQLKEWGHLSGVLSRALQLVDTPFLFIQQHDLPLIRPFALDAVLHCLLEDPLVKHVRLNRRNNLVVGWDRTPLFSPYETPHVSLTRTGCWSDQSHVTTQRYYLKIVLPAIRGKMCFPEDVLNPSKNLDATTLACLHRRLGTFIYGSPGESPIIIHTDARNSMMS
jgi:hypothetical protein